MQAFANLKKICEEHLAGRYQIEVVDLLQNPALPPPVKKIIGDFSNVDRVLVGLDLRPVKRGRP